MSHIVMTYSQISAVKELDAQSCPTPISRISVYAQLKVGIGYRCRLKPDGTPDQPSLASKELYEPSWGQTLLRTKSINRETSEGPMAEYYIMLCQN